MQRSRYEPSGIVDWNRFGPLALLVLVGAAVLAEGMNLLTEAGWYLLFLVPLIAAILVIAVLWKAIRLGRCRSPALAGMLGVFAALVLYLGYYYCGMISDAGIEAVGRIDLLPRYIDFRMQTQTTHDVGQPDYPGRGEKTPVPFLNWFQFIFEFGMVLFLIPMVGYRLAARPFCEQCGQWKHQNVAQFPPGSARPIAEAFERGRLQDLPALRGPIAKGGKKFTSVTVETCAEDRLGQSCPVYFSVKEVSSGTNLSAYQQTDGALGKWWIRRVELNAAEIESLRSTFTGLPSRATAK